MSLKVYFLKSNEPLKVIKRKTERLSQRLFVGRSNTEPNVPETISHWFLSLSQEGVYFLGWWDFQPKSQHIRARRGLAERPALAAAPRAPSIAAPRAPSVLLEGQCARGSSVKPWTSPFSLPCPQGPSLPHASALPEPGLLGRPTQLPRRLFLLLF